MKLGHESAPWSLLHEHCGVSPCTTAESAPWLWMRSWRPEAVVSGPHSCTGQRCEDQRGPPGGVREFKAGFLEHPFGRLDNRLH